MLGGFALLQAGAAAVGGNPRGSSCTTLLVLVLLGLVLLQLLPKVSSILPISPILSKGRGAVGALSGVGGDAPQGRPGGMGVVLIPRGGWLG